MSDMGNSDPLPETSDERYQSAQRHISELMYLNSQLGKSLQKYGRHDPGCDSRLDSRKCTCGLMSAMNPSVDPIRRKVIRTPKTPGCIVFSPINLEGWAMALWEAGWEHRTVNYDCLAGDYQAYEVHPLLDWIIQERLVYADRKYGRGAKQVTLMREMEEVGLGSMWMTFITNYLRRAELLQIQTPGGRQALGKLIVTLMDCLEMAIDVHGSMPDPGYPSGEIHIAGDSKVVVN